MPIALLRLKCAASTILCIWDSTLVFIILSPLQDQRERKASKSHMEEETAKPAEMDKTPKKNPFVPLQVSIIVKFLLPSACGKVMFSQACVKNSIHGGGGAWCLPLSLGVYTPRQTPPPLGRHPPSPPETATAADGTHPTGMHSCLVCLCFVSYPPGWTGPTLTTKRNSGSNQ